MRIAIALCLLAAACNSSTPEAAPSPVVAPKPVENLPPGHPPIGAGSPMVAPAATPGAHENVKWKDPAGWVVETPASSMRKAQYKIPRTGTDTDDGELAVFYFGNGQGGSVDSNVSRWVGQFGATAPTKSEKKTVGAIPVTVVSIDGTYANGMAMPGTPEAGPKANYSLVGAIAEAPGGPWFFKLTGPKATVAAARAGFDELVSSLHIE